MVLKYAKKNDKGQKNYDAGWSNNDVLDVNQSDLVETYNDSMGRSNESVDRRCLAGDRSLSRICGIAFSASRYVG